jgi:polysaccharide biosynthesis/export protein
MYKTTSVYFLLVLTSLFFCSCYSSKKKISNEFNYFQENLDSSRQITIRPLVIQPNDMLNIYISSSTLNQEQVAVFNMFNTGGNSLQALSTQATASGYLVDQNGYIRFPMLGMVKASGLTRSGLSDYLQNQLADKDLVKGPIVEVRYLQLKVNMLGEVRTPGIKTFNSDRVTIIDAITAAGDLTDRGRRDNVKLIREDDKGRQKVITVNLLNADFMTTDAYQLQQNDIIYVYANNIKLKQTKLDPKVDHDLQVGSTILASLSFLITIYLLFKK